MLNHKISRRTFLKATAATTGALAAVGAEGISFDRWQKAMAAAPETVVPTICEMCGVKCGILAHVKDGRVVKIEGNPKHPFSSGRLCARGNAGMKTLYDPDRLRQPLKRVGENQFVPISWDEAVKEIAGKLKELKAKYGPETLVWACHPELIAPWEKRFTEVFGSPNHTGHAPTCFSSRSVAYNATYGNLPGVDYGNVKYYISPGRNLIEGINNAVVQKIVAAHQNGAKLVALDPRLSNFAAWADEWVPLRPGTDGAFLLGLMHVVIKENLYDESFVREKTVGFEELKAEMEKYTPEWAEKITGIKAATIVRIAKEMAALRPAVAIDPAWHGGLGGMYHNGVQAGRAAACLNALMGNLGAKGGLTFGPGIKLAKEDKLPGPALPKINAKRWDGAGGEKWPLAKGLGLIQILPEVVESQKPYPVKALIVSHMNPVRSCPDTGRFLAALKKLELVVAIDIQMSDTAYHAHYILPESAYLERSDPFEVAGPTIALRQPVVKALGDTKGEDDIIIELARAVGTGEYFNYSLEEYNDTLLAPLGISHRQLMQEGVIKVETQAPNYDKLPTPSGKVELASETMKKAGASPVPVWEPPLVEPDKSNFRLLHGHVAMHTHTSTQNNGWLHGLMPENDLWIHPMRAKELGIKNGDLVEVESGVGKVTIKARVTEGIQPEAVFMAHGFGSTVPNQHLAYKRGANHSQLVPIITASLSGAAAQCEVLVKVRKVG